MDQNENKDLLKKALEEIERDAAEAKALVESFRDAAEKLAGVEDAFPDLVAYLSVGHSPGSIKGVIVTCRVDSFRDALPLLEWVEDQGLEITGSDDYVEIERRRFFGEGFNINLFPSATATCRKEGTGEYEEKQILVCE